MTDLSSGHLTNFSSAHPNHSLLISRALIVAALPALLFSLFLLDFAAAPKSSLIQQSMVAFVAMAGTFFSTRHTSSDQELKTTTWVLLAAASIIYIPIVASDSTGPRRWVMLFSFRLYAAPVILPFFLLLWSRTLLNTTSVINLATMSGAIVLLGLFAQPDSAQSSAFCGAAIAALSLSRIRRSSKLWIIATFILIAALSWHTPDPLLPVKYVEGVFSLAWQYARWALWITILAASAIVSTLAWLAYRTGRPELFVVCIYYAVLYLLAPLQVTPVPMLGFGASSIIGYFILVSLAAKQDLKK